MAVASLKVASLKVLEVEPSDVQEAVDQIAEEVPDYSELAGCCYLALIVDTSQFRRVD